MSTWKAVIRHGYHSFRKAALDLTHGKDRWVSAALLQQCPVHNVNYTESLYFQGFRSI